MSFFLAQQDVRNKDRRRKTVRRWMKRVERVSLVILAWCGVVGLFFGGYLAVMGLPLFAVTDVVVQGELHQLTPDAVRALAAIAPGTNVFHVRMPDLHRRLRNDPWIGEVAVRRKLPQTVWIYVAERTPAALLNLQGLYLVDEEGVVFKSWEPGDPADLPVLSGVTDVEVDADGLGHSAQVRTLLQLREAFERTPTGEQLGLAECILDRSGRLAIVTAQPTVYVRLGEQLSARQLERLQQVLPAVMQERQVAAVDLSVERKVIVR